MIYTKTKVKAYIFTAIYTLLPTACLLYWFHSWSFLWVPLGWSVFSLRSSYLIVKFLAESQPEKSIYE